MKRIVTIFFVFMLLCSLTACETTGSPMETTDPSTVQTTATENTAETVTEEAAAETTGPEEQAAFADYVYLYEEQRDREWEEDIVYFAQMYLGEGPVKGHASIVNEWYTVWDIDNYITTRYFYDEQLRDIFIAEIHGLIGNVPSLTDDQITYELQRIVALLGDAHTRVVLPAGEFFPYVVDLIEHNGELGFYVLRIPKQHEKLIYSELVAINDVDIDEVVSRLSQYVSAENEYWKNTMITNPSYNGLIMDKTALQAAGVVGVDADTALFRFLTADGETVEVELEALQLGAEYWSVAYADRTYYATEMLYMSRFGINNYFGTYLADHNTYYIRLYNMQSESENQLEQFLWDQTGEIRSVGGVERLVIDVRQNPGGYGTFSNEMIEYLREADVEKIYILIDGGSFSAAVWFPHRASEKLENVVLVGTPAGQPPNFFAGSSSVYTLNNHDVSFTISSSFFEMGKGFEGDAVMPDVLVYQNLEDYMNGIDTQLQASLEMEQP